MEIELGLNENRRSDVKLYAHSGVFLKVIGAPCTAACCAADARDRNCLRLIEANSGAAEAAFHDRDNASRGSKPRRAPTSELKIQWVRDVEVEFKPPVVRPSNLRTRR